LSLQDKYCLASALVCWRSAGSKTLVDLMDKYYFVSALVCELQNCYAVGLQDKYCLVRPGCVQHG